MLKLLIVDDEEVICRTIAEMIDWNALGLTLVGTCLDGVEAYHVILDENPDIVMTDISMPGISGLDLIERIRKTDLNTRFIILSGYGEFEYAQKAMRSGVKHFLLKPCDEYQITNCIRELSEECAADQRQREARETSEITLQLHETMIAQLISEGIAASPPCDHLFAAYEQYLDFADIPWQYCALYYLERDFLPQTISLIDQYFAAHAPRLSLQKIYLSNILLLFFPDYAPDYRELDAFLGGISLAGQRVAIQYERTSHPHLGALLSELIPKMARFDVVYFIRGTRLVANYNYEKLTAQARGLLKQMMAGNGADNDSAVVQPAAGGAIPGGASPASELHALLASITGRDYLLQLCTQLLVTARNSAPLSDASELSDFLAGLSSLPDNAAIIENAVDKLVELTASGARKSGTRCSPFIQDVLDYLDRHYMDEHLTLKWIAENYLYMNANYVSRIFVQEMNQKFSAYLLNLKIEKAKQIFAENDEEKIQNVAELVGCGGNPYYFTRIFKKSTGMSPSAYLRKLRKQ